MRIILSHDQMQTMRLEDPAIGVCTMPPKAGNPPNPATTPQAQCGQDALLTDNRDWFCPDHIRQTV